MTAHPRRSSRFFRRPRAPKRATPDRARAGKVQVFPSRDRLPAMPKRHDRSHIDHFERHGWVLIERLLDETEIDAAHPGLFALYPTPKVFHAGAQDARSAAFTRRGNSVLGRKARPGDPA